MNQPSIAPSMAREASTDPQSSADDVKWDLSTLYTGPSDPALERDRTEVRARARSFRQSWHGRIKSLEPSEAARMLSDREELAILEARLGTYVSLAYAVDSGNPATTAMQQAVREDLSATEVETGFVAVELAGLPEEILATWWSDPAVSRLRRMILEIRKYRVHILSEAEERAVTRKELTGVQANAQLFDDLTHSFVFSFDDGAGLRTRTGAEMLSLARHPDSDVRRRAQETFLGRHEEHGLVLAHVFNTLCLDHQVDTDMRGYPHPMTRTHMNNAVEPATVEAMMRATHDHYFVAQRFWKAKARLLGLDRLTTTDLYAPVSADDPGITWPDAVDQVLEAFGALSPQVRAVAAQFVEGGWIDAQTRPGKESGAFCSGAWPGHHPYVLLNWTGQLRDAFTLAHELGHGVHFWMSRGQPIFLYDAPLVLAETASVFGEMLLTRRLLAGDLTRSQRRSLLCSKLEDIVSTTFRQNVLTEFELSLHQRRSRGLVSQQEIGNLWWEANAALHGDGVEMRPAYRWGWSYIPHFVHTRFYCYAYVFGELLAMGLWRQWQEDGESFVPRYLELLSRGSSADPADALRAVGIELDADFWAKGHAAIASMVEEFESLIDD